MADLAVLQGVSYIAGALGVCVAAVYYVYNMRIGQKNMKSTLETRQAQFIMQLFSIMMSYEGQMNWTTTYNLEWKDYDDFMARFGQKTNPDLHVKRVCTQYFYQTIGFLMRNHLIDPQKVFELNQSGVIRMWQKYEGLIKEMRERWNDPNLFNDFEYAYNEMLKIRNRLELTPALNY